MGPTFRVNLQVLAPGTLCVVLMGLRVAEVDEDTIAHVFRNEADRPLPLDLSRKLVGFAALRHLTEQDLKDIGVLLGHRRIILAAIQELGSAAAA
jgi:hypothetical protein